MTFTTLFDLFKEINLITWVTVLCPFLLTGVYFRYYHGSKLWIINVVFNSILLILNGIIVYIMYDASFEKNATSMAVYIVAITNTFKLLHDILGETADHFYSLKQVNKRLKQTELDMCNTILESSENYRTKREVKKRIKKLKDGLEE